MDEPKRHRSQLAQQDNKNKDKKPTSTSNPKPSPLQKRYIAAKEANASARRTLEKLQQEPPQGSSDASSRINYVTVENGQQAAAVGASRSLNAYVQHISQEREHATLQIVHRYATRLSRTEAARPGFLDFGVLGDGGGDLEGRGIGSEGGWQSQGNAPGVDAKHGEGGNETVDLLTERLERAILKAKYQLAREEKLLKEIREENGYGRPGFASSQEVTKPQRLKGLTAVQNELFCWIEGRLAESQEAEMANEGLGQVERDSEDEGTATTQADVSSTSIEDSYEDYIKARKQLLEVVARISQSKATTKLTPAQPAPVVQEVYSEQSIPQLLSFVERQLIPSQNADHAAKQNLSYLSTLLKEGESQTLQELDRIAEESHLLSAYPPPSQTTNRARTKSGLRREASMDDEGDEDEISQRVKAWALASKSAATATRETVTSQLRQGGAHLDQADDFLATVQRLAGETPEGTNDGDDEEEDIWTGDINSERQGGRNARQGTKLTGPWSVLNGKIGLDGHA